MSPKVTPSGGKKRVCDRDREKERVRGGDQVVAGWRSQIINN